MIHRLTQKINLYTWNKILLADRLCWGTFRQGASVVFWVQWFRGICQSLITSLYNVRCFSDSDFFSYQGHFREQDGDAYFESVCAGPSLAILSFLAPLFRRWFGKLGMPCIVGDANMSKTKEIKSAMHMSSSSQYMFAHKVKWESLYNWFIWNIIDRQAQNLSSRCAARLVCWSAGMTTILWKMKNWLVLSTLMELWLEQRKMECRKW